MPHLAVIGISGLATDVADLTADKSLLEMLIEVVLHTPEAALHEHSQSQRIAQAAYSQVATSIGRLDRRHLQTQ